MVTMDDTNFFAVILEKLDNIEKRLACIEKQKNIEDKSYKTWISLKEACKRVSLSKNTLSKIITNGDITAKKLDGKWLINVDSLENYLLGDKINIENFIRSVL